MYYYPADVPGTVRSYAHGVGRQDWQTPLGKTSIARKVKDPSWHPPESIRREHAANGDPLPEVVPLDLIIPWALMHFTLIYRVNIEFTALISIKYLA
jgi:L,D-transpeptidase catalytic domain.